MEQLIRFKKISHRFHSSLLSTIEDFRMGNDHQGLDGFISMMDDLENILETNRCLGAEELKFDTVLPILQELSKRIKNQDIVGMTDLLEFKLYPIAKELVGANGNEDSQTR